MKNSIKNFSGISFKEERKGITLIALVITIVVLLILASVSIAMLTGQNGILTQAQSAKAATEQASAKEKVELAVVGAMSKSNDGTLTIDNLKEELSNYGITIDKTDFPVEIELDGQKLAINSSGKVTNYKEMAKITGQEITNTTTKDSLGNYIVVPAGFKIVNPTENVTNGIVIEDVNHTATTGSQFVWIPVGNVIKDSNGDTETITLGRYNFDSNGNSTVYLGTYTEDTYINHNSDYENIIAKDIEDFENKVANITHGYYIGRYEARKNETQLTVKENDTVYNNVPQSQAATLSREMYNDINFESDLANSYAWDTAVLFLQKFDNRVNKDSLKPYSKQNSSNTESLASKGTNSLEDTSKKDKICNIYDLASNCLEWTTETKNSIQYPCTNRGGSYLSSKYFTSDRNINYAGDINACISFRPILYL